MKGNEITAKKVVQTVTLKKNDKSPGPVGIPFKLVKHGEMLYEFLTYISNSCLKGQKKISTYNLDHLIIIFRKGNRKNSSHFFLNI